MCVLGSRTLNEYDDDDDTVHLIMAFHLAKSEKNMTIKSTDNSVSGYLFSMNDCITE